MEEKKICFHEHGDVEEFVEAASECDFDINVGYDRVVIDAKSFLGMIGLGVCRNLDVKYKGRNERFEQVLEKYAACE